MSREVVYIAPEFFDCHGKTVEQVRAEFGDAIRDPVKPVKLNGRKRWQLFSDLHADPAWGFCWSCGRRPWRDGVVVQMHHIGANGAKRSDEIGCIIPLCLAFDGPGCHENIAGNLAKVLWCKWRWDAGNLDWEKLTRYEHCFLPDPIPPPNGDFWLPGFRCSDKINEPTRVLKHPAGSNPNEP